MLMHWLALNQTEHLPVRACVCVRTPGTLLTLLLPVSPLTQHRAAECRPSTSAQGQDGASSQLRRRCLWVLCLRRVHSH